MHIDVVTLSPTVFTGYLNDGRWRDAVARGMSVHDLQQWSSETDRLVGRRRTRFGWGEQLLVDPLKRTVTVVRRQSASPRRLVMQLPRGRMLNQDVVEKLAQDERLILLCGRFQGFEEWVHEELPADEISVGGDVLHGGEVAAPVVLDAVIRLLPGTIPAGRGLVNSFESIGNAPGNREATMKLSQRPHGVGRFGAHANKPLTRSAGGH